MANKQNNVVTDSEVAKILTKAINLSRKTQLDIAREVGFSNPNMITMLKQGRTKLPITKVKAMADALEIEPKMLLTLCLEEYQTENWKEIKSIFNINA